MPYVVFLAAPPLEELKELYASVQSTTRFKPKTVRDGREAEKIGENRF